MDHKEKILLIGGAGFIGSHLARQLVEDYNVIIYDAFIQYISPLNTNYNEYLRYRFKNFQNRIVTIRGDTRDSTYIRRIILEYKPDRIVHLAALPIAGLSDKNSDETFSSILQGVVNVLEILRDINFIKRFLYVSSSMIYGNFEYDPCDENHPTDPISLYGCYKLCGEIATRTYGKRYCIPYSVVRPSAVYGPTDLNQRVSQIFVENALKKEPIIIRGKDTCLDFTFVEDVVQGIRKVLFSDNAVEETFNITYGRGYILEEFVQILGKYIDNIEVIIEDSDKTVPKRGALDISKAKELVGYDPQYPLERGIEKYIEFYKFDG